MERLKSQNAHLTSEQKADLHDLERSARPQLKLRYKAIEYFKPTEQDYLLIINAKRATAVRLYEGCQLPPR